LTGDDDSAGSVSLEPLIAVHDLSKVFRSDRHYRRERFFVRALENVNLAVKEGTTLALVGESGSGKSTLARCLSLLEEPSGGEIYFEGRNVLRLPKRETRRVRQKIQMIFQDPSTALNPRLKASEIIAEPLEILHQGAKREIRDRVLQLMQDVGLPSQWADRLPLELSGGQRQRLALARAIAIRPRVIILDEVFSGLDLALQAQIVSLLEELKKRWVLTYVLISHDRDVVCRMADEFTVLYRGRIVEQGSVSRIRLAAENTRTRSLAAAVPSLASWLSGS